MWLKIIKIKKKMEYRSPLDNVFSFISGLPQGHDKPVKHALYNALALFALCLSCAASYALFVILGPFIKPLIWAVLVGSVLHSFKRSLAKKLTSWCNSIESSRVPIFIEVLIVPVNVVNSLSDFLGDKLLKYIKVIVAVAVTIPLFLFTYYYTPKLCIYVVCKICNYVYFITRFVINYSTSVNIGAVLVGYIIFMCVAWAPKNNAKFHFASMGIWLLLLSFIVHQCGSFQVPLFVTALFMLLAGGIYEIYDGHQKFLAKGHRVSITQSVIMMFNPSISFSEEDQKSEEVEKDKELVKEEKNLAENVSEPKSISQTSTPKRKDPWSLELFENNLNENDEAENKQNTIDKETTPDTIQTVFKEQQKISPSMSQIFHKKQRDGNLLKFQRSQSQPFGGNWQVRHTMFNPKQIKFGKYMKGNRSGISQFASDFYLYSVLWGCLTVILWKNFMLLPILVIPILIYVMKHCGIYLGVWNLLYGYWSKLYDHCQDWFFERYDAFIPIPIRGLLKFMHKINSNIKHSLRESVDTVVSCVVILGLLIFVLCASVFIAIQIYAEAIMLVQMTGNLFNQTVVHNPELRQLLPPTFDDTMDSILDNAYQYGREGISKVVRSLLNDVDNSKSAKLEKQVLELWDRLYQTWMSSDTVHGPQVTADAVQYSWDAFLEDFKKSPEMFNVQGITEFVKQNIGTFMSLFESVWSILKGNISLVLGSFSAFMSVLFGGGTAVLNFILNSIVFLTTLFYLLNSSGDLYKPVELLTNFSTGGSRFGLALEGAVNGVFTATFKMAAFYGLWTWFIHNCFSMKIVYLPSALASILGAVPFLGTYWACLPAVLDLWLAQGKNIQAIFFAIFQFLPTSIVDATIYNEIQGGGHPYLTGLAIAGGIFCLGVEGAIIGPLLLCALYVVIDLSSSFFKESPSEETVSIQNIARL
ncbi:hypothetical protein FQA39_LY07623 [Lamprigera yunnana]|nr:hypothetical protein FQA39_LY07623 [Lamprigera yunnana]